MPKPNQDQRPNQQGRPNQDKPGNRPNKPKMTPAYRAARRDVRLALSPYLQAIKRARQQAKGDAATAQQRYDETYGQLQTTLSGINQPFTEAAGDISQSYTNAIGSLGTGLLGSLGAVPAAERTAGANMIQSIGATGAGTIASTAARTSAATASQQAQAAQQQAVQSRNTQTELSRYLQDLGQQKLDVLAQAPSLILQRMDERKRMNFDRMIALEQLKLQQQAAGQDTRLLDMQIAQMQQEQALMADPRFWELLTGRPR